MFHKNQYNGIFASLGNGASVGIAEAVHAVVEDMCQNMKQYIPHYMAQPPLTQPAPPWSTARQRLQHSQERKLEVLGACLKTVYVRGSVTCQYYM